MAPRRHSDAAIEDDYNKTRLSMIKTVAEKYGIRVRSTCFDGIGKERKYVQELLVNYIASPDAEREFLVLGQHDFKHQSKCGRGACAFGATVCPSGGWVTVNMNLFALLGVGKDNIQVVDKFADFRVEVLFQALQDFPMLLGTGSTLTDILGTQLYFGSLFIAQTSISSKSRLFSRRDRIFCLHWALCVLHSYCQNSVTSQNYCSCYGAAEFVIADGKVVNPARSSTAMLEYFIGQLRTRQNQDNLSVLHAMYVATATQSFHALCAKKGFKHGHDSRTYTTAWQALDCPKEQPLQADAGLTTEEHLVIMNRASAGARKLLDKLGWPTSQLSPLCSDFKTMSEVAKTFASIFKAPWSFEDEEENGSLHPTAPNSEQGLPTHGLKKASPALLKATQVLQSAASELVEPVEEALEAVLEQGEEIEELDEAAEEGLVNSSTIAALLGRCHTEDPSELVKAFGSVCELVASLAPKITHKGLANKRTILEKLVQANPRVVSGAQPWGLQAVCFAPSLNVFGRVITVFRKSGAGYMVADQPADEAASLKRLQSLSDMTHRFNIEAVSPCSVNTYGGAVAWEPCFVTGKKMRCFNVIASDVFMLPGKHVFPTTFPTIKAKPTTEALATNLAEALKQQCDLGWTQETMGDSRRTAAVTRMLGLLREIAPGMHQYMFKASGVVGPMQTLQACPQEDIKARARDLFGCIKETRRQKILDGTWSI